VFTVNVDMNNVTSDGRLRVATARLEGDVVLQTGASVLLHDRLEQVILSGTVDDCTSESVLFKVDWDEALPLSGPNHIVSLGASAMHSVVTNASIRTSVGFLISA